MATDNPPISFDSVAVASPDQLSTDVNSEAVILHLNSGFYFGLNQTGARVWELLQEPRKVGEIRDRLVETLDVDSERCGEELLQFLEQLRAERLVEVRHDGQVA
jgi:hypothetical protein